MTRQLQGAPDSDFVYRAPAMDQSIVDFGNPPVNEVVCGLGFQGLKAFSAPHMGLFWGKIRGQFPIAEVKPRLATPSPNVTFTIGESPAPRYFLRSEDRSELVQIQEDRFIYNWIKTDERRKYPRYAKVIVKFQHLRKKFEKFLKEEGIDPLDVNELRLTYVNHVQKGDGWEIPADVGKVFPTVRFKRRYPRYLVGPEKWQFSCQFPVRDPNSRLEYMMQTNSRRLPSGEIQNLFVMHLTVVGNVANPSASDTRAWFDMAREAIDLGFLDLTHGKIQREIWKIREHGISSS